MTTLKFKVTENSGGYATFQNSEAAVGRGRTAHTYEVTDIPDGISATHVQRLFNGTTIMPMSCFSVPFSECGIGRIYFAKR